MSKHPNLNSALLAVQKELKNPEKTAKNPFHKNSYSPLDEILETVKPVLSDNELTLRQGSLFDGLGIIVYTILTHAPSGEAIKETCAVALKPGADSQQSCSALTYGKRYAIMSLFSLVGELDDDGNQASGITKPTQDFASKFKSLKSSKD